jgi:uroporphyrinogen-III synthase
MTPQTIVITRPLTEDATLADELRERGHTVIHEPMTQIRLNHTARADVTRALQDDPDAVIVTSGNGVRALAALTELRDIALVCIGDGTAAVGESCGFGRVASAHGDSAALLDYIAEAYDQGSRFLYASAEHVRTDLAAELAHRNMQVERIAVYEAVASDAISDTLIEQCRRGQVDAFTFLSQRSSSIFASLAEASGLAASLEGLNAFALSDAVARPIQSQPWKAVRVAKHPTLASLLECIDNMDS